MKSATHGGVRPPVPTETKRAIVQAYENGERPMSAIAERFGVSLSSVSRWVRFGIEDVKNAEARHLAATLEDRLARAEEDEIEFTGRWVPRGGILVPVGGRRG